MICQEVIELMQRYLDQDLDEIEYNKMLHHLQQCDDCTELFQRLVSLSHELEQLPRVTPAYSLVDAIMPKLDRIDAGYPAVELPVANDTLQPMSTGLETAWSQKPIPPVAQIAGWRKRMRSLVSARIVGGVVAAGLVLGFFVFEQQQDHSKMNNADGMLPAAGSAKMEISKKDARASATEKAASPSQALPQESKSLDAAPTPQAAAGGSSAKEQLPPAAFSAADTSAAGSTGAAKTPPAGAVEGPKQRDAVPPVPLSNPTQGEDNKEQGSTTSSAVTEEPPTSAVQEKEQMPLPLQGPALEQRQKSFLAQPPLDSDSTGSQGDVSSSLSGIRSKVNAPAASDSAAKSHANLGLVAPTENSDGKEKGNAEDPTVFGFNSLSAQAQPSLDGSFNALINEERQVVIRDNQDKVVFNTSHQWSAAAKVTLGQWTEDHKLTYQVIDESGTTTYIIDAIKKSEVKK